MTLCCDWYWGRKIQLHNSLPSFDLFPFYFFPFAITFLSMPCWQSNTFAPAIINGTPVKFKPSHIFPLTVGNHQFTFVIGQYSIAKIWYFIWKRTENDKNTNFVMKNKKKMPKKYIKILSNIILWTSSTDLWCNMLQTL